LPRVRHAVDFVQATQRWGEDLVGLLAMGLSVIQAARLFCDIAKTVMAVGNSAVIFL